VKLGGSLLEEKHLREKALGAIAARWTAGKKIVVVHGGGKRIDASLQALKIPKKTYRASGSPIPRRSTSSSRFSPAS